MRKLFVLVVGISILVAGCNSTGGTKVVGTAGGEGDREDPRVVKSVLDAAGEKGMGDAALAREETRLDPMTPEEAVEPKKTETKPTPETQPAEVDATKTEEAPREVGVPESDPSSVKLVPEVKKPEVEEPVLDSHDADASEMVSLEHMAMHELADLGARRCMVCDDVSDLVQCLDCGHHHKKSAGCPEEHLKARCEACYGKKGETVVTYDKNEPCGVCGEVHETGPHCPHCLKSEEDKENEK